MEELDDHFKEYPAHKLVGTIIVKLDAKYKPTTTDELLYKFCMSKTYELLLQIETGLWTKGPDYIIEMYEKE